MRIPLCILTAALLLAACKRTAPPAAKLPFDVRPDTTVITAPLHADGTPDYVAAINQIYGAGVTPQSNGYVLVLQALGSDLIAPEYRDEFLQRIGSPPCTPPEPRWENYWDYRKRLNHGTIAQIPDAELNEMDATGSELWSAEKHPHAADYLAVCAPRLDLLAQAVRMPHFWRPAVGSGLQDFLATSKFGSALREMSYALAARATLRMQEGDFDGFLADVSTLKRLARACASQPLLIDGLQSLAIEWQSLSALSAALASGQVTEPQCQRLTQAMAEFPPLPGLRNAEDTFERWQSLQTAIMVAMGDKAAMQRAKSPDAWFAIDSARVDWNDALAQINHRMDADIQAPRALNLRDLERKSQEAFDASMKVIGPALGQALSGQEIKTMQLDPISAAPDMPREDYTRHVVDSLFLVDAYGALYAAERLERHAALHQQLTDILLALAQVRARTGAWPASADQLPAEIRRLLFDDPYADTGTSIRYVLTPKGPRIFSLGPDGKPDTRDDLAVGINPH